MLKNGVFILSGKYENVIKCLQAQTIYLKLCGITKVNELLEVLKNNETKKDKYNGN